jgi:multicomponent Na+:H+ antiporter subunit E
MPEHSDESGRATDTGATHGSAGRAAAVRATAFSVLWLVLLPSYKTADLLFGAFTALTATWLSLRLLPPAHGRLHVGKLLQLLPHFLYESARGGVDVAFRALAPQLPTHPGTFRYVPGLPPGLARNTFASITSLLPGTLACGEADDALVYHVLDLRQPAAGQLREEERRISAVLITERQHE